MNHQPTGLNRLRRASGVFLFIALSGFIPFLVRYGVISQWILLLHIVVGVLAAIPLAAIFLKHLREANRDVPTPWWSPGLWAGFGWVALGISGLWLAGKGIWGVFVPYRMHYVHILVGIVFGTVGLLHVVRGTVRSKFPQGRYVQLLQPLVFWTVMLSVGAVVIGIGRHQGTLATGDFSPRSEE